MKGSREKDARAVPELSEDRFRMMIEMTNEGIWSLDSDLKTDYVNSAMCRKLGYSKEEIIGRELTDFLFEEDREEFRAKQKDRYIGSDYRREQRLRKKNGEELWTLVYGTPLKDAQGSFQGVFAMVSDITELKRAEFSHMESVRNLDEAQRIANIGSWELNLLNGRLRWSREVFRIFELDPSGFTASYEGFLNVIHPEDREMVDEAYTTSVTNRTPYDIRHRLLMPDGRIKWVRERCETYYDKQGKPVRSAGTMQDITQTKAAEDQLNSARRLFETIVENVPNMIFMKRASDLSFEFLNHAGEQLVGMSRDKLIGHSDYDFFPKEQADFFTSQDREVLGRNEMVDIPEEKLDTPQGTRILHTKKVAIRDAQGRPQYLLGISEDLTERKQTEANLLEKESQYRMAIETSPNGFYILDMRGRLIEVNQAYAQLTGYSRDELLNMTITDLDADDTDAVVQAKFSEVISNGGYARFEKVHKKKDGTRFPVEIIGSYSADHGGRFYVFITDLTKRRLAEQELLKAREAVYRDVLIREVHHRIKNNLQGIIGVLRMGEMANRPVGETISDAISQIQSISILHGLQGRTGDSMVNLCDLATAIAANGEQMWNRSVNLDIPQGWIARTLVESETVPVALILNELIANAIKHGAAKEAIRLSLDEMPGKAAVIISIYNTGILPAEFGLDKPESLGVGLQLVASLMPGAGASLCWKQEGDRVLTRLELDAPVVSLSGNNCRLQ